MGIAPDADLWQVHDGHVATVPVDGASPLLRHGKPHAPRVLGRDI